MHLRSMDSKNDTMSLDALDSATPVNPKRLMNHFKETTPTLAVDIDNPSVTIEGGDSDNVDLGLVPTLSSNTLKDSKKRGTLNSSVNLYTFVKLLEETAHDCQQKSIEIIPENLTKFVQRYRLNVNKFKDSALVDDVKKFQESKVRESTPSLMVSDDDVEDVLNNVDTVIVEDENIADIIPKDEVTLNDDSVATGGIKRKHEAIDETTSSVVVVKSESIGTLTKKQKQDLSKLYLKVFNCLFVALERENITISFSREHLRYFLATYQKFITLDDFKYTNKQNNDESTVKKNKSKNILHNGSILLEYVKSPAAFQNNLSRCNNNDVDALRYITSNGIILPENIYKPLLLTINDQIVINKTNDSYEGYVKLMFNGTKHYIICFTENILLIWDGVQFVIPTLHVERDITATLLYDSCKSNELYILQTFVCCNKLKIADVLYAKSLINNFSPNLKYTERQQLFKKIFKNWDVAKIENECYGNSNVQIPNILDGTKTTNRYVFTKPGQTVAAVGMDKQNVLIAFKRTTDDDLEFKLKVLNCGPASTVLLTQPMRFMDKNVDESSVCIRDQNDRFVKIHELPFNSDFKIFKNYISVELRDGNKLGAYVVGPIDDVTEYKQQNVQKNQAMARMFEKIINDPKHLQEFMTYFEKNVNDSAKERFCSVIKISERITDSELNFKF